MSHISIARAHTPRFIADERGLSTVEYVILLVLIAAAAVGGWQLFRSAILAKVSASNTAIVNMQGSGPGPSPGANSPSNANGNNPSAVANGRLPISKRH